MAMTIIVTLGAKNLAKPLSSIFILHSALEAKFHTHTNKKNII
jgi:hypothetical protein